MFDWFEPVPALRCPFCDAELAGWQGKDCENALLDWRQGQAQPTGQRVDESVRMPTAAMQRCRLPEQFTIYTYCPNDGQQLDADCQCQDDVWVETVPAW